MIGTAPSVVKGPTDSALGGTASDCVVKGYDSPMGLRAVNQLRENIRALMRARGIEQQALAFALRRHPTWINKFLKGTRPITIADLDGLADFFGLSAYQLFMPGISSVTERRRGDERRAGRDRRISQSHRQLEVVAAEMARARNEQTLTPLESAALERIRALDPEMKSAMLSMMDRLKAPKKKPRNTNNPAAKKSASADS